MLGMDHAESHPACSRAERRRRAEPYVFFFGTMIAIALAIALVCYEAYFSPVGPKSAQPQDAPIHHH